MICPTSLNDRDLVPKKNRRKKYEKNVLITKTIFDYKISIRHFIQMNDSNTEIFKMSLMIH